MELTVTLNQKADTLTVTQDGSAQSLITSRYRPGQNLVYNQAGGAVVGLQLTGFRRNWTSGSRVCDVLAEHFNAKPAEILRLLLALTTLKK